MIAAFAGSLLVAQVAATDAGASDPDAGVPQTLEIQGIEVPLSSEANSPGHRPVEGAVDDSALIGRRPTKEAREDYSDFLEEHVANLTSCASWSSDGKAIKGWLSVEWTVGADGVPTHFSVLKNELDSPLVERCMLREMAQWRFLPPPTEPQLVRHNFYLMLPARTELTPLPAP